MPPVLTGTRPLPEDADINAPLRMIVKRNCTKSDDSVDHQCRLASGFGARCPSSPPIETVASVARKVVSLAKQAGLAVGATGKTKP